MCEITMEDFIGHFLNAYVPVNLKLYLQALKQSEHLLLTEASFSVFTHFVFFAY